jgi:hypothetical protein
MAKKRPRKMSPTGQAAKLIRLELFPEDHKRLEKQASKRGLSKAAAARMIILEWLADQERKESAK